MSFAMRSVCFALSLAALVRAAPADPVAAARGLLQRIVPERAAEFELQAVPPQEGRDVFELESSGGKIAIRGSSGVAIASGLDYYLTNYARGHVSFCGDQLALPRPLPPLPAKIRRASAYPVRYCFNYCAFSYTLAFWDWPAWERMIDWMALRGITMPLAVTGQEAVWHDVYRDLGLTEAEIDAFLVGPAFLPFGWMGCIDNWCGPPPPSWIERHAELGRQILARERELGMTPVLQGFTGHVPQALTRIFPEAKLERLPSWCEFPGTYFLAPTDPLFERVGKAFIEAQAQRFGTDHLYASDTFIEMSPPSFDPAFLSAMGRAVHRAMQAGDPDAIWVMQGWLFFNNPGFWKPPQAKALLTSVPDDRMLVLDLYCEHEPTWNLTEAFHGKPWLWCVIQSFGAQVSLHGGLPQIVKNFTDARTSPGRGRLEGLGLIMEGFGYNPVVYDLVTSLAWRTDAPQLEPWLQEYAHSRYGARVPAALEAWRLLGQSAYTAPGQAGSLICARPSLELTHGVGYDAFKLAEAWRALLDAAGTLGRVDTFQFDLVNVARQTLTNAAVRLYGDVVAAFHAGDRPALATAGRAFTELVRDLDDLLATRREFLLGAWLADAARWGTNDAERLLLERNARTLITLWGGRDSILHEYSQREWSGMLRGFYLPRWEMCLAALQKALSDGRPFDPKALENALRDWELAWTLGMESYGATPRGDPTAIARRLWDKYRMLVLPTADGPSLTTGAKATCSAALPEHEASLACNGETWPVSRFWAIDVSTDPHPWWQADLARPVTVGRVVIVLFYGDRRYYGFTLEGSLDGHTWEMLTDRRDAKLLATQHGVTCVFQPREVRYLRVAVTANSANTGRHLVEVMAFPK